MKKLLYFVFCLMLVLSTYFLSACNNSDKLTISYYSDGALVKTEKVNKGDKFKNYTPTSNNGYTFAGWEYNNNYIDYDMIINEDISVNAIYSGYDVEIKFYNGNNVLLNKNNYLYSAGDIIEAPKNAEIPSDNDYDYEFIGWDKEFGIAQADMEIRATYDKTTKKFKVVYYSYDKETVYLTNMVEKNSVAPSPELVRESDDMFEYKFNTWYTEDGLKFDFNTKITQNTFLYPGYTCTPKTKNSLEGLTVSMLGDSVSTFYSSSSDINSYYHEKNDYFYPIYSDSVYNANMTWWMQAINKMGARLGINNSLSGSCVYGGETATQSTRRINTLNENGEPDIIFIMITANDNVNGFTLDQVRNAYKTMLNKVHSRYPNAYVFCITWGYVGYTGYNYTEERRLEFNQMIRDLCESDPAMLIDWATVQTKDTYKGWLSDSMHLNKTGMEVLGNFVYEEVNKYLIAK